MEKLKLYSSDGNGFWPIYLSVAFVAMSVLILEIAFTRIFSLVFEYHYVFLLVSLAILGLGTGGIYIHIRLKKLDGLNEAVLPIASGLMAVSTLGMIISVTKLSFFQQILLATLLAFFPFFFAGIFISAAFRLFAKRSSQLYAADLIGASLGAILALPLLRMGGINVGLFAAFLGSLPMGFLLYQKGPHVARRWVVYGSLIGFLVLFGANVSTQFLGDVLLGRESHKEIFLLLNDPRGKAKIIESRWSAFGRTDLVASKRNPDEMALFVDGTAGTSMYRFDGDLTNLNRHELTQFSGYFPFELLPEAEKEKVLIIGSGGGREVLIALLAGGKDITAVEVNRDLVDLVRKYSDFNGGIYNGYPGVKVMVQEGRNYVRSIRENYDIIMLSVPVTKTSRSPEGFALTENFLFTVESINDYLDHLNPNGRLVIVAHQDVEIFRLVFTSLAALKKRGIEIPSAMNHLYTVGPRDFPVLVLKKSPLTLEEAQRVHDAMHKRGYLSSSSFIPYIAQEIHTIPLSQEMYLEHKMLNQALYLMARGEVSPEELIRDASFEIRPVSDNDPFFYKFDLGIPSVVLLLVVFSSVALFLAWFSKKGNHNTNSTRKESVVFLLLFCCLGIGFMLIEIPLIQKFILFLGQPVYAFAVLLFSILIGAGAGSWLSGSFGGLATATKIRLASMAVAIFVILYLFSLDKIFNFFLGRPFSLRMLLSFLLLGPLGFFMGMPFPLGIKLVDHEGLAYSIPRMWGINGIGSVLGSSLAIAIAISFGFSYAMILGAMLYFLIFILLVFPFRGFSYQSPQGLTPREDL